MGTLAILLISISLSFDSFAASVCCGLSLCKRTRTIADSLKIALSLAIFQGSMPIVGFYIGEAFKTQLVLFDHWFAFAILLILGIRMIKEGSIPIKNKKIKNPTRWRSLLPMSVATSIDALAVGVGFSMFIDNVYPPAMVIALVTFLASMLGINMGKKLGKKLAGKVEIAGGITLILIGTKILLEHLLMH